MVLVRAMSQLIQVVLSMGLAINGLAGQGFASSSSNRTFTIDYSANVFLKDGVEFQIMAGAMHYFMIPPDYWEDRLLRVRASGLNAIQVYVAWNFHEQSQGEYLFSGWQNLPRFLSLANKLGLLVVLRPGPYIDNAWDMGGLPWWLLKGGNKVRLRTSDPKYLAAVEAWWSVLLPNIVKPALYSSGGPIIAIQVENEYGSYYACDKVYMTFLRDLLWKHLGKDNVVLFTTDGGAEGYFPCGMAPDVYPTIDFGPPVSKADVQAAFGVQRHHAPNGGPFLNSEYYTAPADCDRWGHPHREVLSSATFIPGIIYMWDFNASFSIYMIAGGTFFGYWAGSFGNNRNFFQPVTTTFDFGAPVFEEGNYDEKFFSLRRLIEIKTGTENPFPIPPVPEYAAYGRVPLLKLGTIFEVLEYVMDNQNGVIQSEYPLNSEDIDAPFGFILYTTVLPRSGTVLTLNANVHDRAYYFINGSLIAVNQRPSMEMAHRSSVAAGDVFQILIENQGRICYDTWNNDSKGLNGNITLDGIKLTNWTMIPLKLENLFRALKSPTKAWNLVHKQRSQRRLTHLKWPGCPQNAFVPSVYVGKFEANPLADTYLDLTGWSKGQALVNGINLGRYWPAVGPQIALYSPKPFLKPKSTLLLFELDGPGNCDPSGTKCAVTFRDKRLWR